ncbi:hypothetical protein OTK49_21095 [Vibrio coralliirubri]|uniref:hypothetical protein n=1 Tax=Vibrio coralliirubri TaxID=1516159 RepID=UPI0022834D23|nr:hypothetical protein [Vibrio coralliirubri]MCY9865017.1 hypothetical protein [Vibrio coralliirubri]
MKNLYNILAALIIGTSMPRTFDFVYNLNDATSGAELLGNCIVIALAFATPFIIAAIVVGVLKFIESCIKGAFTGADNLFNTSKKA